MSRFFVTGYTSDTSSEEEDLLSTSEEEALSSTDSEFADDSSDSEFANASSDDDSSDSDTGAARAAGPLYFLKKSFVKGADSDSDSEDEGRKVVKSARDKLLDDLRATIDQIHVAKRQNQWTTVLTVFDRLGRLLVKANQQKIGTPRFYIACLASLEDHIVATTDNERAEKTLTAAESRAFNTTKQRVRKQLKEYARQYEQYREDPEAFEGDEPLDDESLGAGGAAVGSSTAEEPPANAVVSPAFAALKQVAETRGKKNVDKAEQIVTLEGLLRADEALDASSLTHSQVFEMISLYQMLLLIRFDALSHASMPLPQWRANERDLNSLIALLEAHVDTYQVSDTGVPTDDIDIEPLPNASGVRVISGSVTLLVDRLDDEFTKSLQNTDPHLMEYVERLKDETAVYALIVRAQKYVESIVPEAERSESEQLARIVARRLEHVYYKPVQLIEKAGNDVDGSSALVESLVSFLRNHANPAYQNQAFLQLVYHLAVNNQYARARELFVGSRIHSGINNAESDLQIQYNRALVQLGLSAFRAGAIEELSKILSDIIGLQRARELLGQGFNSKYPNQATTGERLKLLPFHMHINLELLECVYMTSLLLMEIPQMAAAAAAGSSSRDSRRRQGIKLFKSKLEFHDKQFFTGPPESIKDHIVHASIALQRGDWARAYALLLLIKIWRLLPDYARLLQMLRAQLQVEGLRTYIFTYKGVYSTLSLAKLAQVFELEATEVASVVQKMVDAGEIDAALNTERTFVRFGLGEPQRSRLQELAIVMNEKVGALTERNEKTASNGFGKKPQKELREHPQKELRDPHPDDITRFRCANVSATNDEFQSL